MSDSAATTVVSDEAPGHHPTSAAVRWLVQVVAVAMSLYHMYVAAFGPPEAIIFRGTHLLFALVLVFLLYPTRPGHKAWRAVDFVLLALSFGFILHIFLDYEAFINRIIYIDDLRPSDKFFAVAAILIVLEGTRRVIGLALPLTAVAFLVFAGFFTRVTPDVLMEQVYLSTEGIFGSTLGVSASYVMLFVLFGAFMEKSGTGQLFMDFAMSITGHQAGGPGKVAIVSSSLFGTVSGSAVANVMVDGPLTIPLMKRTGFRPPFAAAVEAVASTGGQIMPPVMGAAAFVMAEFLVVPYAQVALWALVPALLYYIAVFFAVHFEAKRYRLAGVPKAELPRFWVGDGGARASVHSRSSSCSAASSSATRRRAARWPARCRACRWHCCARARVRASAGATCSTRWWKARATRWRWRWPAPAPASSSAA